MVLSEPTPPESRSHNPPAICKQPFGYPGVSGYFREVLTLQVKETFQARPRGMAGSLWGSRGQSKA